MNRRPLIPSLLVLGLLAISPAIAASPPSDEVSATCAKYQAHLRSARESLESGDRTAAVAELHRARDALAACVREDAGEVALASRESAIPSI